MNKDRIGVAVLLLGLVALLGFEAMNYARKTSVEAVKPKAVTQSAEPQESAAAGPVANAGEPEREAAEAQTQSSSSAVEIPADWSTFSADEFGFQIARPANWPAMGKCDCCLRLHRGRAWLLPSAQASAMQALRALPVQ